MALSPRRAPCRKWSICQSPWWDAAAGNEQSTKCTPSRQHNTEPRLSARQTVASNNFDMQVMSIARCRTIYTIHQWQSIERSSIQTGCWREDARAPAMQSQTELMDNSIRCGAGRHVAQSRQSTPGRTANNFRNQTTSNDLSFSNIDKSSELHDKCVVECAQLRI